MFQRFGGEAGGSGGGGVLRETRFLREELNEMEHQITLLQKDLKDKERQLVEERQISERVRPGPAGGGEADQ